MEKLNKLNKEFLRKYKREFEWFILSDKKSIWYKYPETPWKQTFDTFSTNPDDWELIQIVIGDKYVELRKALVEGKTIQYYVDGFVGWVNIESLEASLSTDIESYRIKLKQ